MRSPHSSIYQIVASTEIQKRNDWNDHCTQAPCPSRVDLSSRMWKLTRFISPLKWKCIICAIDVWEVLCMLWLIPRAFIEAEHDRDCNLRRRRSNSVHFASVFQIYVYCANLTWRIKEGRRRKATSDSYFMTGRDTREVKTWFAPLSPLFAHTNIHTCTHSHNTIQGDRICPSDRRQGSFSWS